MTQNPRRKKGVNDVLEKHFKEAAKGSTSIEEALDRMGVPSIGGNVRKFRKRAKAMGLDLPYLKKDKPVRQKKRRATPLSVPMAELLDDRGQSLQPEEETPVAEPTRKKKRGKNAPRGSVEEKLSSYPIEKLQEHLKGATSLRQIFQRMGQDVYGGKHAALLRDRIIEEKLDISDLQSIVRDKIKHVPDDEFKELVESFDSLENIAKYIGIPRLTDYVKKVLKTRIKEMHLDQRMKGKKDSRPAPPPRPGEEPEEPTPEPPEQPQPGTRSAIFDLLEEDEAELQEFLQEKVERLEAELEEVHKVIEEAQERRNSLVARINKLKEALR